MAYSISATDDHCYPGTTVLINKLDIRDQEKLNEAELFIVGVKSLQFEMEPFPEDLDFAYYKRLHQFLFGELYDWAGSVRNIDISKQRTRFCPAAEIPVLLDIVLRIQDRKHKSALNLFCHLSEAVEVQGILLFQEMDCDVAVSSNVRLGQVFRPLQKSVIQEHAVVGQRKLLVPDLTLNWITSRFASSRQVRQRGVLSFPALSVSQIR